jgi:hypothetical protein
MVMPMPIHDPQPVDISKRRANDYNGNPLRTRRFGVMGLEDSYHHASNDVTVDLRTPVRLDRPAMWSVCRGEQDPHRRTPVALA